MSITINGNGTITGISVGGLPNGIVDNDMIANTTIADGKLAANVNTIKVVDQWRLNSTLTVDGATVLVTNWERPDGDGFGYIGSGVSVSSGIFTFPETGIYHITFTSSINCSSNDARYPQIEIYTTTDNSSYGLAAIGTNHINRPTGTSTGANMTCEFFFDVTDVSTHKCRMSSSKDDVGDHQLIGDTNHNSTMVTFVRFGDT